MTTSWTFLTNHARVLLCISRDPGMRLREIADRVGITERSAYRIVQDLAKAGYIFKEKDGRRNRYRIEADLRLPEPSSHERTVGEALAILAGRDRLPAGEHKAPARAMIRDSRGPGLAASSAPLVRWVKQFPWALVPTYGYVAYAYVSDSAGAPAHGDADRLSRN